MSPSDDEPGSVTRAIGRLDQDQDQSAAELLWQSFFERLRTYAESRLYARHKRVISGEDIASSTMHALCEGAAKGRFASVRNRDGVATTGTHRSSQAINAGRELGRQQRRGGGNQVRGDSVFGEAEYHQRCGFHSSRAIRR
ncbi:MAG: ECF-type sigma factor [Pirellulaceae bacterium]